MDFLVIAAGARVSSGGGAVGTITTKIVVV